MASSTGAIAGSSGAIAGSSGSKSNSRRNRDESRSLSRQVGTWGRGSRRGRGGPEGGLLASRPGATQVPIATLSANACDEVVDGGHVEIEDCTDLEDAIAKPVKFLDPRGEFGTNDTLATSLQGGAGGQAGNSPRSRAS